jgi:hypothetical protein
MSAFNRAHPFSTAPAAVSGILIFGWWRLDGGRVARVFSERKSQSLGAR